jgi:hypothetical protein
LVTLCVGTNCKFVLEKKKSTLNKAGIACVNITTEAQPQPNEGKGSYFNPKTGTRYYLDKGGMYKKGFESPHIDIWYNGHPLLEKVKFFLDGSSKIYK